MMESTFDKTDLQLLFGDKWDSLARHLRVADNGLYLAEQTNPDSAWFHPDPDAPVLPLPFTLEQFCTFCDWHPTFNWETIVSTFTKADGSLNEVATGHLNRVGGVADLVRAVLMTPGVEHLRAWRTHEQIDEVGRQLSQWEKLEKNAMTPRDALDAEQKLSGLYARRDELLAMISVNGQDVAMQAARTTASDASGFAFPCPPSSEVAQRQTEGRKSNSRRDLLRPVIESAQSRCEDPFDAPAVWAVLVSMAATGKRPLLGVSDEGIKWMDPDDAPRFLTLKNLRDRLRQWEKRAR